MGCLFYRFAFADVPNKGTVEFLAPIGQKRHTDFDRN